MTEQTTGQTYPCTTCGAQLAFKPGSSSLGCPYCGTEVHIELERRRVVDRDWESLAAKPRRPRNQVPAHLFVCTQCGAHTESDTWSDVCQFCDAPVVVDTFDPDLVPPEGVLPFQVDRSAARERLREWVRSRWFAPNKFKHVDEAESLKSTYLPHWTWDAETYSRYTGQRGEHYYVEDDKGNRSRRTRWYPARGSVSRSFDDVVVPATNHVSRKHLNALSEDWPTNEALAYQPEFLSGHHTQRYDVEPEEGLAHAKEKMARVIEQDVRRDIGGDEQRVHSVDTTYTGIKYKLLLLPVWLVVYLFGGKSWQVLVSGQTGRVTGERPWSAWKIAIAVTIGVIIAAVVLYFWITSGSSGASSTPTGGSGGY
ncbi:TFIIB-type zinc ribbon-containing protein [Glycomyces tarimensis]